MSEIGKHKLSDAIPHERHDAEPEEEEGTRDRLGRT